MSQQVIEDADQLGRPAPNGELVHWMDRKPLSIGPAGMSVTAGAAFTAGVLATVAVLALLHWLGPERAIEVRRRVRT
ncbi:MAG: hypothetical protein ACHP9T_03520 [Caulobacterales bacterium]